MNTLFKCPGSSGGSTPVLYIRQCAQCGGEVELFSTDMKVECPACRQAVFNTANSCAEYCQYAEQCLGREAYLKHREASKQTEEVKNGKCCDQDQTQDS